MFNVIHRNIVNVFVSLRILICDSIHFEDKHKIAICLSFGVGGYISLKQFNLYFDICSHLTKHTSVVIVQA